MYDDIILKKAAYESTLEIFRQLHSIKDKPDNDNDDDDTTPTNFQITSSTNNTGQFIDMSRLSPNTMPGVLPRSNGKVLKTVITKDETSSEEDKSEGDEFIPVDLDEDDPTRGNDILPLVPAQSDILEQRYIDLFDGKEVSEIDSSTEPFSTVCSIPSESTIERSGSLILDQYNSQHGPSGSTLNITTPQLIPQSVGFELDGKPETDISNESFTNACLTLSETGQQERTSLCVNELDTITGCSTFISTEDKVSIVYTSTKTEGETKLRLPTNDTQSNEADIDLRTLILSPDGGAELLQSEEYLKNMETPVLINILNQLTSGIHDDILPPTANHVIDKKSEDIYDRKCTEEEHDIDSLTLTCKCVNDDHQTTTDKDIGNSPTIIYNDIDNDRKNIIRDTYMVLKDSGETTTVVSPTEDMGINREKELTNESFIYESYDEQTSQVSLQSSNEPSTTSLHTSIKRCDSNSQYQLIQELRDMKLNLSNIQEAFKLSTAEEPVSWETDNNVHGRSDELIPIGNNDVTERTSSPIVSNKYDLSQSEELNKTYTTETSQDHKETETIKDINKTENEREKRFDNERDSKSLTKENAIYPIDQSVISDVDQCTCKPFIAFKKHNGIYNSGDVILQGKCNNRNFINDKVIQKALYINESKEYEIDNESYQEGDLITSKEFPSNIDNVTRRNNVYQTIVDRQCTIHLNSNMTSQLSENKPSMYMKNYIFESDTTVKKTNTNSHLTSIRDLHKVTHMCEDFDNGDYRIIDLKPPQTISSSLDITDTDIHGIQYETKHGNEISVDMNGTCPSEINEDANTYLTAYIFGKDSKNLDDDPNNVSDNSSSTDVDENVSVYRNKTHDAEDTDTSPLKYHHFENDINYINERMKQIAGMTTSFEVELNELKCKASNKKNIKNKTISLSENKQKPSMSDITDNISYENDVRITQEVNISEIVRESLLKIDEVLEILVTSNDIPKEIEDTKIEKESTVDEGISVLLDQCYSKNIENEVSRCKDLWESNKCTTNERVADDNDNIKASYNRHPMRNIFDREVTNNSTMLNGFFLNDKRHMESYVEDFIDGDYTNNEDDDYEASDIKPVGNISNVSNGISLGDKVIITSEEHIEVPTSSFDHLYSTKDKGYSCGLPRNEIEDELHHEINADNNKEVLDDVVRSTVAGISLEEDGNFDSSSKTNDENDKKTDRRPSYQGKFHADSILEKAKDYNRYLHLDMSLSLYKKDDKTECVLSTQEVTGEMKLHVTSGQVNDLHKDDEATLSSFQSEISQKTTSTSENVCVDKQILPEKMTSTDVTDIPHRECNGNMVNGGPHVELNEVLQSTIEENNVRPITSEKYRLPEMDNGNEIPSSESDDDHLAIIETYYEGNEDDTNIDSSLEDTITQLLTIGGTFNKPFVYRNYFANKQSTPTDITNIYSTLKVNKKQQNKLQHAYLHNKLREAYLPNNKLHEAYLPNNNAPQKKSKITLELRSSGLLPEDDDIGPYLSSVQVKDVEKQNNISVEMT